MHSKYYGDNPVRFQQYPGQPYHGCPCRPKPPDWDRPRPDNGRAVTLHGHIDETGSNYVVYVHDNIVQNVVFLDLADYEALSEKDNSMLYVIRG